MSPNAARERNSSARISIRFLSAVSVCSVVSLVLPLLASPIPTGKPAAYPDWWFVRDVVARTNSSISSPVYPDHYPAYDNYSVLIQGQFKNLAAKACDEMESKLPASTWTNTSGIALTNMVYAWSTNLTSGDNFAAINHGQLKTVAAKFYDVLAQQGYVAGINLPPTNWTTGTYPWTSTTSDDDNFAIAVAGQAKNLFSFDLDFSQDGDSLPDWWENANGLDVTDDDQNNNGVQDGLDDFDGDGVVNATEFADETRPLNASSATNPPASETDAAGQNGLVVHTPLN